MNIVATHAYIDDHSGRALKSHSLGVSLTPRRHISHLNFCIVCISSMESHSCGAQLIIHISTHFILYLW